MRHIRRGILTNTVDRPRYLVRHEQSYRLVQGANLTPPEVGAEVPDTKKRCPAGNTDKRIEQRRCLSNLQGGSAPKRDINRPAAVADVQLLDLILQRFFGVLPKDYCAFGCVVFGAAPVVFFLFAFFDVVWPPAVVWSDCWASTCDAVSTAAGTARLAAYRSTRNYFLTHGGPLSLLNPS